MITTAASTPMNVAMTGIAMGGRPWPVAPFTNDPTPIAATMITTV
jgi:hypothetical protein